MNIDNIDSLITNVLIEMKLSFVNNKNGILLNDSSDEKYKKIINFIIDKKQKELQKMMYNIFDPVVDKIDGYLFDEEKFTVRVIVTIIKKLKIMNYKYSLSNTNIKNQIHDLDKY